MKYTVLVDDNFHYMDDTNSITEGEFDTAEDAIACAKTLIDKCVADLYSQLLKQQKPGTELSADDLFRQYGTFGETPYVVSEDKTVTFSGWSYAKVRCDEIVET